MPSPAHAAIAAVQALCPGEYRASPVGGGCIHACFQVQESQGETSWFVKVAQGAQASALLAAEANGLQAIQATHTVRTPQVLGTQNPTPGTHCLVLEYLALIPTTAGAALGRDLAALHQHVGQYFGWSQDNFLGLTPQPNTPTTNAVEFLAEQRLGFQLRLGEQDGLDTDVLNAGWRLQENLAPFYTTYQPRPSLLHGDLWQGNQACLSDGTAVVFDPAVHYGDPEADLAMTELFGGFGADFYAAYREHAGIDVGYEVRRDLHQLYHVLNHCHLFGAGYTGHARRLIQRLHAAL